MVSYYDKVMKRNSLLDQYMGICNDHNVDFFLKYIIL